MEFNPYSIPPIISLGAIFTIGQLFYRQKPSSPINQSFRYLCLSLSFWLVNFSIMYNCKDAQWALLWGKIGFLGVTFIPITCYIFTYRLLNLTPIPHLKKLTIFALLTIPLLNSNLIYGGIKKEFWGFYPVAGKFYFVYIIFFVYLYSLNIKLLFSYLQKIPTTNHKYKMIRYVLISYFISLTGIVDFIAKYPVKIYPFAWLSTLIFILFIIYAIFKENQILRNEITQSERMKSIAILASGMAHEIKNPLTPIKTFSEQLPLRINDKEFLLNFSRIINKEVDRIDNLVQELLSFAKPSPPQLKKTNVHQLMGQILVFLNNEIIKHKIDINISIEHKDMLINIDPQQIKQALLNIFLNAIDAMPEGGRLSVNTYSCGKTYTIEIADSGYGIGATDLPHIFDPFFTKKDHGTGLGLSITHEIIQNHHGKITAESELGKGTTFRIELPV